MDSDALTELAVRCRNRLEGDAGGVCAELAALQTPDVASVLNRLSKAEAGRVLEGLPTERAVAVLNEPTLRRRGWLVGQLDPAKAAKLLAELSADQRVDVLQALAPHETTRLLPLLPERERKEAERLLKYADTTAGGIMTTEFVRLAPDITVGQALKQIRREARDRDAIYACYVIEPGTNKLLGAVSLRDLVMAEVTQPLREVCHANPIFVNATDDRRIVARKLSKYNLLAVPVVETDGSVVGFVTVDDAIDVMVEAQTDDVLRMGAIEPGALDEPYLASPFMSLVKKRAVWLIILFVGELFTATAMGYYEGELEKAVVLGLFIPLIISSGGNSGSQATSLLIRALALTEVRLDDWWRVFRREVLSGLTLGLILGSIGFLRITIWHYCFHDDKGQMMYGQHWLLIASTVGLSLVGVVLWGSLSGAMLPFILKRCGIDPATSSAPFVATLVDVTGLVIYFTVASLVLRGTLL